MSLATHRALPDPGKVKELLQRHGAEYTLFLRELPRLIEDGEAGHFAVIHGEMLTVWETYRDARQYAMEKYPDGKFLTQQIDARLASLLPPLLVQNGSDFIPATSPAQSELCPSSTATPRTMGV